MLAISKALPLPVTERIKACVRLPLFFVLTLFCPPLAGMHLGILWVLYILAGIAYSMCIFCITKRFIIENWLGYVLTIIDVVFVLPLMVGNISAGMVVVLIFVCVGSFFMSSIAITEPDTANPFSVASGVAIPNARGGVLSNRRYAAMQTKRLALRNNLESAINTRLKIFKKDKVRFGLLILRVSRFEEISTYYGKETAGRLMSGVGKRGLKLLGEDAQRFSLLDGRVAFLFEIDKAINRARKNSTNLWWNDISDVETLALALGSRICERLIEGQRVECIMGWSSVPKDGLSVYDLLKVAETGICSTAAFRRVNGSTLTMSLVPKALSANSEPERAKQRIAG